MYGWMAGRGPGTTFWEGIGANGSPYEDGFTSMAHGCRCILSAVIPSVAGPELTCGPTGSTGIVPLLTTHVLGITPLEPGFSQWKVRPTLGGGLTWAAGRVPTPSGEIRVRWERAGLQMRLRVSAPIDTNGTVVVPLVDGSTVVALDGRIVYDKNEAVVEEGVEIRGHLVVVPVSGGYHQVLVS